MIYLKCGRIYIKAAVLPQRLLCPLFAANLREQAGKLRLQTTLRARAHHVIKLTEVVFALFTIGVLFHCCLACKIEANVVVKAPCTMERIALAMCKQLRLWAIAEVYSKASTACITTAKHSKAAIHLTMSSFTRTSVLSGVLLLSSSFSVGAGDWTQEAWERTAACLLLKPRTSVAHDGAKADISNCRIRFGTRVS